MAQINRMMGNNAEAWSIYRQLLNEYIEYPNNDHFYVFSEIATDMPHVETEKSMEIWYLNIFNYLEYVYARYQERSDEKDLFRDELIDRYRTLGRAYWYLIYDKERTLFCYNRWKELLDKNGDSLGELLMYMAHTYFINDSIRAKSLYEQAIVELAISEEIWCSELAICYCRLGYLQKRKRFFIRCFYLLTCVADLSTLIREKLEETGECYFYLAKSYTQEDLNIDKSDARQFCEQALRLFLNVKPPTSNFRDMQDCVQFLLTLQENDGKKHLFIQCPQYYFISFYKLKPKVFKF
jgi:tetratricopeptide (TPR) repeat protein